MGPLRIASQLHATKPAHPLQLKKHEQCLYQLTIEPPTSQVRAFESATFRKASHIELFSVHTQLRGDRPYSDDATTLSLAASLIENGRKQLGGQGEFPIREQPITISVPELVRPGLALCLLTSLRPA